jgi:hypothetical protein
MNGYLTPTRFSTNFDVPLQLPQTELRRGRYLNCGQIQLTLGQAMRVRLLDLHLVSILTASATPQIFSTALGVISAGIYTTPMMCSSPCLVSSSSPGVVSLGRYAVREFATPGIYYFLVSNNTSNVDVSVVLTGVVKVLNFG